MAAVIFDASGLRDLAVFSSAFIEGNLRSVDLIVQVKFSVELNRRLRVMT